MHAQQQQQQQQQQHRNYKAVIYSYAMHGCVLLNRLWVAAAAAVVGGGAGVKF